MSNEQTLKLLAWCKEAHTAFIIGMQMATGETPKGGTLPEALMLAIAERGILLAALKRLFNEADDPVERPCWIEAREAIAKAERPMGNPDAPN